ncbi:MAG: metallophosphoesterase family protein [Candidatus Hodarchaeales archaeon]|jgi:3',5'-cyclic AMP phosphodiesterase CpdA
MKEKLILWSDSHISNWTGQFNKKSFESGIDLICRELQSSESRIEMVHLGDLTDEGVFVDYSYANEVIIKEFAKHGLADVWEQTYKIPGNHDVRNEGSVIWESFYGERNFLIELENLIVLGIDSCEPDMNSGRIGGRGVEEILRLQPYSDDMVKILCIHHHLVPIPNTGRERSTIQDAGDIIDIVFEAGVDVVLTGHRHHPHWYTLHRGGRKLIIINSGTFSANKTRAFAGHSFVVLGFDTSRDRIDIRFQGTDAYSPYRMGIQSEKTLVGTYVGPGSEGAQVSKIIQLSDTHFSSGSAFLEDIFDLGITAIKEEEPDAIVHCGNLTNNSYREDYRLARAALKDLRSVPVVVVPGPYDLHPLGKELFVEKIGPLDPLMELMDLQIVGLSTGAENPGVLGRARVSRIMEQLAQTNKPLVVAMHHSPIPVPRTRFEGQLLDAGVVLFFLTKMEIPLVLTGLDHYAYSLRVNDSVFINCSSLSNPKLKSRRLNTYNCITLYDNGVIKAQEVEIVSRVRHDLGWYHLPNLWSMSREPLEQDAQ